tara:strand:- start:112 stop:363 length:252 start_codon:yes stop_codon:yes gene_type:complete
VERKSDIYAALQTLILVATAAGVFLTIGRRDQVVTSMASDIQELRAISMDLVRSQVLSEATDANQAARLDDLRKRIDRLEQGG